MEDTQEHFVATIKVEKISRVVKNDRFETVSSPRQKSGIASITISAGNLIDLRKKIASHVALIDDGGDISGD